MLEIGGGDKIMEDVIKYVDWFLKEEGTTFQDKIEYEKAKEKRKSLLETARSMLQDGVSMKAIIKYTGLSKQDIENIKQEC